MDERLRFLLYGTYDGFSRSSLGDDNIHLILDNGDKVEIPNHFVKNASDFVEKNKIKLKDIIARMEGLNGLTRLEWLDDILYKFGSSYGASKYSAGYKQGKLEGEWVGQQLKDADKIRQELNKPVVKQFVADWYEEHKDDLDYNIWNYVYEWENQEDFEFKNWFNHSKKAFQTLVNMHQFGYTVEKEKRYLVKMKGMQKDCVALKKNKDNGYWYLSDTYPYGSTVNFHTRKELEDAGFGWVFDCPGVEVEEVE
jgi:hypothetical protein